MADLTYLHIRGTLAEDMVYSPRPGFESARPGPRDGGDPAYQLVLLDRERRVLVSVAPQVSARGCGHADDPLRFSVRGVLPLHPEAVGYELRKGEIRLHGAAVAAASPSIEAPCCETNKDGLALRWHAPSDQPVTYSIVAEMESGRRFTIARGLKERAHDVDLSRIPSCGKGRLLIVAHDGVRSSEAEAGAIEVPERPPAVHILAPAPDARFPFGQPLSALGCCLDSSGEPCPPALAVWSLDGERFAAGSMVAALHRVPPGRHKLTLRYGSDGEGAEASISVTVDEPDDDHRQWEELMAEAHRLKE